MQFDGFEQNIPLRGRQIQVRQDFRFHHLARPDRMFHILFHVTWKRTPIMHVSCEFHDVGIMGYVNADLFDKFKQAFGMCQRPVFPRLQSHLDDVIKCKLSIEHLFLLSLLMHRRRCSNLLQ